MMLSWLWTIPVWNHKRTNRIA